MKIINKKMLTNNMNKIFFLFLFFLAAETREYITSYILDKITHIVTDIINYVTVIIHNYYISHIYLSKWNRIILSIHVWCKNAINHVKSNLYNVYISYMCNRRLYFFMPYIEPVYCVAFLISLYHNSLSIYFAFFTFTFSILTLYNILFFNLNIKKQYTLVHYFLLIASTISILACIYIFSTLLINIILNITVSTVKCIYNAINYLWSTYNMNNDYPRRGSDQGPTEKEPNTGGSNKGPRGPGPESGAAGMHDPDPDADADAEGDTDPDFDADVHPNVNPDSGGDARNNQESILESTEERKKRLKKEQNRKYRQSAKGKASEARNREKNSETIKEAKRKYNKSDKGKESQVTWRIDNHERVKNISDKYINSEKGKETLHNYRENNKSYLKDCQDNWREEHKDEIKKNRKEYHERNKERSNRQSNEYYKVKKNEIRRKHRVTAENKAFNDLVKE